MTEAHLFPTLVGVMFGWAILTLLGVLFIVAPYGRHARGGWGPVVPARIAWVTMESPAAVGTALVFAFGAHRSEVVPLVLLAMWEVHYVNRTFVYPLRLRGAAKPMPALVVLLGFLFNSFNAYLNARWISHFGEYAPSWLADPRFLLGAALMATGFAVNLWADGVLRKLRRPGETGYAIPRGGLYEWVSCPNYLGEITEWLGWALATWSLAGLAFALYTAANVGPRAVSHHAWYKEQFPAYPPKRKALMPYVF